MAVAEMVIQLLRELTAQQTLAAVVVAPAVAVAEQVVPAL